MSSLSLKEDFPLTVKSKKEWDYLEQEGKRWERNEEESKLEARLKSLNDIRSKILKSKIVAMCHPQERVVEARRTYRRIEEEYKQQHGIESSSPIPKILLNRFVKSRNDLQEFELNQVNNRIKIIEKLLNEIKKVKLTQENQPKQTKVLRPLKLSLQPKEVAKSELEELVNRLPLKSTTKESQIIVELLEKWDLFKKEIDESFLMSLPIRKPEVEDGIQVTPSLIEFKSYVPNNIYTQKCTFQNTKDKPVKIGFSNVKLAENVKIDIPEVFPLEVKTLCFGMTSTFTIRFKPTIPDITFSGMINFWSQRASYEKVKCLEIPFTCVPDVYEVKIEPTKLVFKAIPFWKTQNKTYTKTVKVTNLCNNKVFVHIRRRDVILRKVEIPFDINSHIELAENKSLSSKSSKTKSITPNSSRSRSLASKSSKTLSKKKSKGKIKPKKSGEKLVILGYEVIPKLINEILDDVGTVFRCFKTWIEIPGRGTENIVFEFSNAQCEGDYNEFFKIVAYKDDQGTKVVSKQFLECHATCSGFFYTLDKILIDFRLCALNYGIYQEYFTIGNHHINVAHFRIKLEPKQLTRFCEIQPVDTFIPSNGSKEFQIRFQPTLDLLCPNISKFLKLFENILEFEIQILADCVDLGNAPIKSINVYAILNDPNLIFLTPPILLANENSTLNLEFIEADTKPKIVDLGFVTTRETVCIDIKIINKTSFIQEFGFLNLPEFIIIQPNYGFGIIYPNEQIDVVLFYSPSLEHIVSDELHCCGMIGVNDFQIQCTTVYKEAMKPKTEPACKSISPDSQVIPNSISFTSKINDVLCEFDYQYLEFSSVAIGSYAVLPLELRACSQHTCYCGLLKKVPVPEFVCNFEIKCNTDHLTVQPRYGTLRNGEVVRLMVIATPTVTEQGIMEQASVLKSTRSKETTEYAGKKRGSPSRDELNSKNLYEAEKQIWMNLEPYTIEANITCLLKYSNRDETLSSTVVCPVDKPDFILNWPNQVIDFGLTPVDVSTIIDIELQNISQNTIFPKISLLSPTGPFSRVIIFNKEVDPGVILKIPFIFKPTNTETQVEFFTISSGKTIIPMKIQGIGIIPEFTVSKNTVYRTETVYGKPAEISIEVKNSSTIELPFKITKGLELKGIKPLNEQSQVLPKGSKKTPKFELNEEYLDSNNFELYEGPSYFQFKPPLENDMFLVKPKSKFVQKIVFSNPPPLSNLDLKSEKSNTINSKSISKSLVKMGINRNLYLAKFDVFLGGDKFLQDFVVIGGYKQEKLNHK